MIVCLGTTPATARSMVFDSLRMDDVNRAAAVFDYAAGKAVNAARVLTTLGERAIATGFLGGERAAMMRRDLDLAGVAHDFLDVAAPTRLCVTLIDRQNHVATELVEESHPVTANDPERLLAHLQSMLAGASLLVLSGSLAPGVPSDFYRRCIEMASTQGVRTVLDASGEPLRLALPARPFVVKPNAQELAAMIGKPIASEDQLHVAMREVVGAGAMWIVVTRGRHGAVLTDGGSVVSLSTPVIQPVSAIGSGDSFAAGLAAGIVRGQAVPEAAQLGAACGAANALTERSGFIPLEIVQQLVEQITVI